MGWKSTIEITRKEAIAAIEKALNRDHYEDFTNEELEQMMYGLDIGDDIELPYHGYEFIIRDNEDEINNFN